jgi:poly(A) polymerase
MVAINTAAQAAISDAVKRISIPRRFSQPMREIWEFQLRLQRRSGRKAAELIEHRRFRAGYDFLLLREQVGEDTGDLGKWWTDLQVLPPEQRLANVAGPSDTRKRSRRPRTRRPTPAP